jgi:N-acetylmuramoyl-L-alanine amidase
MIVDHHEGLNLDSAFRCGKAMQDFDSEPLSFGSDHSQKVKAPSIGNGYGSKDGVDLSFPTAESRLNTPRSLLNTLRSALSFAPRSSLFLFLLLLSLAACSSKPRQQPIIREIVAPKKTLTKKMPSAIIDKRTDLPNVLFKERANTLIMIDPGHGGKDLGTFTSKQIKYREKTLNLTTARMLNTYLKQMGYSTVMTRSDDVFVSLDKRAEIANAKKPKLFVSIHYNSAPNEDAEGIEVFFFQSIADKERSAASKKLAQCVLKEVLVNTEAKSRGVKHGNLRVIRKTNMPAILIEGGFLTNQDELKNIKDTSYQKRIAWGIAQGIQNYLSTGSQNVLGAN